MGGRTTFDYINTLIGENTLFKGEITTQSQIRIDGDVQGDIRTTGQVMVSQSGRVKASITAREVVVGGVVKGDIFASERVAILQSGMVLGRIYSPLLSVEDGGLVEGVCSITPRIRESGVESYQFMKDYYSIDTKLRGSSPHPEERWSGEGDRPVWNE